MDILERLEKWASVKDGTMFEDLPKELFEDLQPGQWGKALRKLHIEAADEIRDLREDNRRLTRIVEKSADE